jgi:uncharacterized surface protein with fasciclin (FAS1) repeats
MKIVDQIKKTCLLLAVFAVSLTACNKLELDATPNPALEQGTTPTLATLLDDPGFSLLKQLVTKAGLMPVFATPTLRYTLFAPDNNAVIASLGVPDEATAAGYIATILSDAMAKSIVEYHTIPQVVAAASIPTTFPNFQYPSLLNPAPAVSALLRLTTFPSVRSNGAWVNNIPIVGTDIQAVNGVLHKVARVILPPSQDIWAKINGDAQLTYLKAAINRADSGVAKGGRLTDAISIDSNTSAIGSNLTIFAPTDSAMKAFLTGSLTQAFIDRGAPPANAQASAVGLVDAFGPLLISNPASIPDVSGFPPGLGAQIASVLTPALAKGIVVYHILSSQTIKFLPPGIRVFSVNLPATATQVKTLLNSGGVAYPTYPNDPVTNHPGLSVQAMFFSIGPGVAIVSSATVKGLANSTASNIIIGPGSSDIHCINGVMHKIDQVLRPQ